MRPFSLESSTLPSTTEPLIFLLNNEYRYIVTVFLECNIKLKIYVFSNIILHKWHRAKIMNNFLSNRSVICFGHSKELSLILFDLILYVPVNNFSVLSGQVLWVEPLLSKD